MDVKRLIIIGSISITVIMVLLYIIQKQKDTITELKFLKNSVVEMKTLHEKTVRSEIKVAQPDDLSRIVKKSGIDINEVKKDLNELNSEISGVQEVLTRTPGFIATNMASSGVEKRTDPVELQEIECPDGTVIPCEDTFGYMSNRQYLNLKEPFTKDIIIPYGEVGFSSWKKRPWDLKVYQREYSVTTLVSEDEDGKQYYHNKFTIETNGKKYTAPIAHSVVYTSINENRFRFNPRLYFGIDSGILFSKSVIGEVSPNLGFAFFRLGKSKLESEWIFLYLGIGYESQQETVSALLMPVAYNIGKPMPLMDNLFLGPSVSFDLKNNWGIMVGLKIGL